MRENRIEQALVKAVKARGGICPKLVCPSFDGMPDRLVLLPGDTVILYTREHVPSEELLPV